jgi:phage terminase large subunit
LVRAEFPEKLQFLFEPARNKVAYGGRGSAKSWSFAKALLIAGANERQRVPCCRETQKSLTDSVHALLTDQIKRLGLESFYEVQDNAIIGRNETLFTFHGLKHNVASIKSLEGADKCWIEEAQTVSAKSWDVLIPTIRKPQSEMWVSFNPDLETDDTYQRWVVKTPPNSIVRKVNYTDNPWCPDVLKAEADHLKATDPDKYSHVWLGNCISYLDNAIYAKELRETDAAHRITRVPYDRTVPVHTFWDLGWADRTSIWFVQVVGFEYRIIDFLEGSQNALQFYLLELQKRGYLYGTHYLPHDARAHQLGTGRTIEEQIRSAGFNVSIVPNHSIADGIAATRAIFPQCFFDGDKCADGLQALRHYRYGLIEKLGVPTREPLHDEYSHAADAFRMFGVGIKAPKQATAPKPKPASHMGSGGWMR